jgi:hypothetical protein
MTTNLAKWASNNGQIIKSELSDGCGRKPIRRQRNSGMITMDLKAIWEMSVESIHIRNTRQPTFALRLKQ